MIGFIQLVCERHAWNAKIVAVYLAVLGFIEEPLKVKMNLLLELLDGDVAAKMYENLKTLLCVIIICLKNYKYDFQHKQ